MGKLAARPALIRNLAARFAVRPRLMHERATTQGLMRDVEASAGVRRQSMPDLAKEPVGSQYVTMRSAAYPPFSHDLATKARIKARHDDKAGRSPAVET